jgi:hypothetical protein
VGEAAVLTIKRCREILGPRCTLTDDELEALRDQFYMVAEVALTAFASEGQQTEPGNDEAAAGC